MVSRSRFLVKILNTLFNLFREYNKFQLGSIADVLAITKTGYYYANEDTANTPSHNYFYIHAQELNATGVFVLSAWGDDTNNVKEEYRGILRTKVTPKTVEWHRVDNFGCNTPSALASLLGDISGFRRIISELRTQQNVACDIAPISSNSGWGLYIFKDLGQSIVAVVIAEAGGVLEVAQQGILGRKYTFTATDGKLQATLNASGIGVLDVYYIG